MNANCFFRIGTDKVTVINNGATKPIAVFQLLASMSVQNKLDIDISKKLVELSEELVCQSLLI